MLFDEYESKADAEAVAAKLSKAGNQARVKRVGGQTFEDEDVYEVWI
jgi:hypothetical protein